MANPLFYKNVVAVNSETHRSLRFATPAEPLAFARKANLVPALIDEFEHAMEDLPIAFLPGADQPAAVFVTGLKPGTNRFISKDGLWNGKYCPAYLRRYPFIVGDVVDGEPILCFDDSYFGLNQKKGERFFSKTGEFEQPLLNALAIAQSYRTSAERTDKFGATLKEYGLLRAISLDGKMEDGESISVHGLLIIDEDALATLSGERLQSLHEAGFLKAIYSQLFSLKAISRLGQSEDQSEIEAIAAKVVAEVTRDSGVDT